MTPKAKAVLDRLYESDAAQRQAGLKPEARTRNVDFETGKFLHLLSRSDNHHQVLEIGSSNGVSTIWFASAVEGAGGRVTGTEILPDRAAEANVNLASAGLDTVAAVLAGDARRQNEVLVGPYDLVFIDAEKEDYADHLQFVLPLVRDGGVILADNVLSHDLSKYQTLVKATPELETVTFPLERGLEFTVKRTRS